MVATAAAFAHAGIVDCSERGKLRFTGEQSLWFCDQLLSNKVVDLADGAGAEALLLTPNGRITAHLRLVYNGGEVLADMEPGLAGDLATFFQGRVFATRVAIEDVTDQLGIVSVLGPEAGQIVAAVTGATPPDGEHASDRSGSVLVVRVARPLEGLDLILPLSEVRSTIEALAAAGAVVASAEDYEALRAPAGLARHRVDYDESFLPQEAALERAVHFSKGCYLGQEAVAMTQRGRIKRRLRHLRFDGPSRTGGIRYAGEEVGRATTASGGYAIATVRTSVPIGEPVEVGGDPRAMAVIEELPGTVAGPKVPSARELRESLAGAPKPRAG